ncbi:embryo defective 3006, Necessary for Nuclear Function 1 [Hibiscus trionum]|uniref:Embryo defective 3006, Necessary for Nuclear Function 1 n=1 Tax=Hibiscus trionum TaxID=183268 RepID=A0A9W7J3Y6_HIBTR|nr:embryo defective 3006, Necessary for Nuclear Function 1 [Hibiscus trionum]
MSSRDGGGPVTAIGKRQSDLKKSFNLAVRSLLTTCSAQEFSKAFPNFTNVERERLHQLFIQVITSLHGNVEDEFESLCQETQVGVALDTVEQHVEEQSLDPLFSERSNVMDAVHSLSSAKKAEINYLRGLLERAEEHNRLIQARVDLLKNNTQEVPDTKHIVEKLRGGLLSYKGA